jgi:glycosyltransferase involved in cell wall biosynthesis
MRIGIDARLLHYQAGGISQYTRQLVAALAALDADNDYHILHMRQQRPALPAAANVHPVACWTPSHHRFERLALALELLPLRLDLLHSTDFIPPAFGYRHGIITVHDLNFLYFPEFLTPDSRAYYVDQIAWAVRRAGRIIAVSDATRVDLIERLGVPEHKVAVVYEAAGAEFQPWSPEAYAPLLARYRISPGFILFVGTLEPRKNLPTLLQAYARLRSQNGGAPTLVFAGRKGWLFQEVFTTAARLELVRHVRFVEDVRREELPGLYSAASALVLPSFYEGFGLPALEALQCGTPVVASNRAALPEIVGDAGLLVEPNDPEALAGALARVLADGALRAELRERGLARARQFSWQRAARETLEQYRLCAA